MVWDLLLYVPTVAVLVMIGLKLWYGRNQPWAYLLFFLASFFFIAGANRILKTRLMLLPNAPVALDVSNCGVHLALRNGQRVDLVKDLRFYADTQGESFGLTGKDVLGKQLQYVFHRGQFLSEAMFREAATDLKAYK